MNILTITEYNNMGDLSPGSPQEPPIRAQKVRSGCVSEGLTENTRVIALWTPYGGEFATFDGTDWEDGDSLPDNAVFVPIQGQYEIVRIVHMNANLKIAFRDGDHTA